MRLTAEVISSALVYMNPVKQREINLRGFKIPHIENLGVTNDEYEVIDLSDNEIAKLENIPLLQRLTTLLLSNNRINKIATELNKHAPKLDALILTNNRLSALSDLDPLASLTSLHTLSLLQNPCTTHADYRLYVIHLLPKLVLLDFAKVKPKERESAREKFGAPPTLAEINTRVSAASSSSSHTNGTMHAEKLAPGQGIPQGQAVSLNAPSSSSSLPKLTPDQLTIEKKRLVGLINAATNLEEVNQLQKQLETLVARHAA